MKLTIMFVIFACLNCLLVARYTHKTHKTHKTHHRHGLLLSHKTKEQCGPILCAGGNGGCCHNKQYTANAVCRAPGNVCCYDQNKMVYPLANCNQCPGVHCDGPNWPLPPSEKPKPVPQEKLSCWAWWAAKSVAKVVLEKGCNALGNKSKDGLLKACDSFMVPGLCKNAVNAIASFIPQGCGVIAQKIVDWIGGQCRRYRRSFRRSMK